MAATRIKICGVTRVQDAQASAACGADAIGLVFYPRSSRAVTLDQAADIVAAVPPFVSVVALFVDEPIASIERTLNCIPIDVIQFHGEESPEFCEQFGRPWVKALRVKPGLDIGEQCQRFRKARAILLDSWQAGVVGGTGKTFDWRLAQNLLPMPIVLAGGLNPNNVGDGMRALSPAAVDVSGGIEAAPGLKDADKIKQFVAAVRAADQQMETVPNDN
ncbi:MAG: phosphoribosylanthranilate isomerase [Halioglobus sp.]|nr:phosphoribosylanthranilate isomerase [Halioglobus sp.]